MAKKSKKFKKRYYAIALDSPNPRLLGEFDSRKKRDAACVEEELRNKLVLWADVRKDGLHIGRFIHLVSPMEDDELPQLELEKKEGGDAPA